MNALFIIDMLNDFIRKKGALYIQGSEGIVPTVEKEIENARRKGYKIIYICDAHEEDDREFDIWPPHCIKGSWGAEVIEEIKPEKGDITVEKTRYSGFYNTALEKTLREHGIEKIRVVGVATNICVLYTVADARMRNFDVEVVEDGVCGTTKEEHEWALNQMEKVLLARIV